MNKIDLQKKLEFIKTKGKPPKIEIDKQEYTKDYFTKVTKQRKRLCEVCSKEIKYNSFYFVLIVCVVTVIGTPAAIAE